MKRILCAALLGALAQGAVAADLGVSISIGDPNFYGRIDIGNFPRPVLMYPQPVIIQQPRYGVPAPLYLRVPPGHARDWRKHCARYDACGRPVYFVQDNWYRDVYAPRYRAEHDYRQDGRRDERYDDRRERREDRYDDRRERRDERYDDRRDRHEQRFDDRRERREERGDDRGGHGHGHGHGRGD